MTPAIRSACAGLLAVAVTVAAPAAAQGIKPEEAVKMRQGVMTAIKWQFAPIGAVAKGEAPFDTDVLRRAANLASLSKIALEGFAVESDMVATTKAKPEIWTDGAAFRKAMENFQTEAERLTIAVQSRDPEQLKKQFLAVGGTCKSCHDKFRSE